MRERGRLLDAHPIARAAPTLVWAAAAARGGGERPTDPRPHEIAPSVGAAQHELVPGRHPLRRVPKAKRDPERPVLPFAERRIGGPHVGVRAERGADDHRLRGGVRDLEPLAQGRERVEEAPLRRHVLERVPAR